MPTSISAGLPPKFLKQLLPRALTLTLFVFLAPAALRATETENRGLRVLPAPGKIVVDGKLDDWKDVLPQIVVSDADTGPSLTEKAWLPFATFPEKQGAGLAVGYMAYDDQNFYFAAKVSDSTPSAGTLRFAARDDDQYFYPEICHPIDAKGKRLQDLVWPAGVRRFTYRTAPDLPFGSGLWSSDGIQLAFNVLPDDKKGLLVCAPGTMD